MSDTFAYAINRQMPVFLLANPPTCYILNILCYYSNERTKKEGITDDTVRKLAQSGIW